MHESHYQLIKIANYFSSHSSMHKSFCSKHLQRVSTRGNLPILKCPPVSTVDTRDTNLQKATRFELLIPMEGDHFIQQFRSRAFENQIKKKIKSFNIIPNNTNLETEAGHCWDNCTGNGNRRLGEKQRFFRGHSKDTCICLLDLF